MNLKTEIRIAKVITASIIALALLMATRAYAGEIATLFRHYNRKLSQQQAIKFESIVKDAGKRFGVSPNLIASIIVVESSARPNVISKGGDYGLMQVRWKVHKDKVNNAKELLRPEVNIMIGTRIFADYSKRQRSLYGALKRYSGGNRVMAQRVIATLKKLQKGEN